MFISLDPDLVPIYWPPNRISPFLALHFDTTLEEENTVVGDVLSCCCYTLGPGVWIPPGCRCTIQSVHSQ
jgi:hypothetical protein